MYEDTYSMQEELQDLKIEMDEDEIKQEYIENDGT